MQLALFDASPILPEGFRYQDSFLDPAEETVLVDAIRTLDFQHFRWHEYVGKRRTVIFGWSYSFDNGAIAPADPLPGFLVGLQSKVAQWAGVLTGSLVQALVTEYQPGAAIGWHRDAPPFGIVLGVSLLSDCRFRLRLEKEKVHREIPVARRSIYALTGPARTLWQHGIPAAATTRYSITFRTLRNGGGRNCYGTTRKSAKPSGAISSTSTPRTSAHRGP